MSYFYDEWMYRSARLVQQICAARQAGGHYVTARATTHSFNPHIWFADAPDMDNEKRESTWKIAHAKAHEVFITPHGTSGVLGRGLYGWVSGYAGGLRTLDPETFQQIGTLIAAFSGWPEPHDVLLAALALASWRYEFRLHHVGTDIVTETGYRAAQSKLQGQFGSIHHSDSKNRRRFFAPSYFPGAQAPIQYLTEFQLFPEGLEHAQVQHIDVSVMNKDPFAAANLVYSLATQATGKGFTFVVDAYDDPTIQGPVVWVSVVDHKRDYKLLVDFRFAHMSTWTPKDMPLTSPA